MFVAHADWGVAPRKRWVATARGAAGRGWAAEAPVPMPAVADLRVALGAGADEALVVGLDLPIGLPRAFAARAGIDRFLDVLALLGRAEPWTSFFDVADEPGEVSLHRPFFPRTNRPRGERRRTQLTAALDLGWGDLLRRCERATADRNEAASLFWTLGANQVGKGAIEGWRLLQQQAPGTRFWPFDGTLDALVGPGATVVAEAYPAEFHGHLGLPRTVGKRTHEGRVAVAPALLAAADRLDVALSPALRADVVGGFGTAPDGEDRFDAVVGLLGMLGVLAGERPPGEPRDDDAVLAVEGWILGQAAAPATLVHLNGVPGAGKSAVARALVDRRPGALLVEVDELRTSLDGWEDDEGSRLVARSLALALAEAHLRAGHDVVLPQYVGRPEWIGELERAARRAGARFVEIVVDVDPATAADRFRARRRGLRAAGERHPEADVPDAGIDDAIEDARSRLRDLVAIVVPGGGAVADVAATVEAALRNG